MNWHGIGRRLLALTAVIVMSAPLGAEQAETVTAEDAIARAHEAYGAVRRTSCGGGDPGEIVVCARRERSQHVPSTAESDPSSLEARRERNNGVPLAPQLDRGSCKGQAGCITGGWAPPPLYIIDLQAIPEAPEGSDADKVAKGEIRDR